MYDSNREFHEHQRAQEMFYTDTEWRLIGEDPPNYKHKVSTSSWALWEIVLLIIALAIVCVWIYGIYTFITLVATYCS